MQTFKRWLPPLLALALVAVLAGALLRGGTTDPGGPLIGKVAPDFTLTTLDGARLRLADLRGRPVLLNFWASWCIPCRDEAPLLQEAARRQRADGLVLVGVVFQDTPAGARAFRDEFKLAFPSVLDPGSRAAIAYGVSGVPETFFIDQGGVIRGHVVAPLTRGSLSANLARLGVGAEAREGTP